MAKLFLESTDTRATVSDNNVSVYGASNDQVVVINGSLTGVVLDSNVERVQFTGSTTDYKYVQAGTDLKVYNATGDLVSTIGLQDDTTGTQLTFANGTVKAAIVAPTATAPMSFSIGGTAVTAVATTAAPTPTPAAVTIASTAIDTSLASALLPSFSVAGAASATEGSSALFTVTLANPSATTATTVKYALTGLNAATTSADYGDEVVAGTNVTADYNATLPIGTLTFAPGATTATITVPVTFDSAIETGEGVTLTLSLPSAGTVSSTGASVTTAFADAPAPTFTMTSSATAGISVQEGNTITFTVTPSGIVNAATVLNLNVVGAALGAISATTSATDFTTASAITFAAGETAAKTITVTVVNDGTTEGIEAYKAQLLDSSFNEKAAIQGTVADALPTLTLSQANATVNEGGANTYTITSSAAAPAGGLTVPYTVAGTATSGTDYTAVTGTATILAGATTGTFTVTTIADKVTETAETLIVTLGTTTGANLSTVAGAVTATTTILDTSTTPVAGAVTLSSSAATITETAGSNVVTYTVELGSAAPAGGVNIPYTLSGTATNLTDYTGSAATTGNFTILAGATAGTLVLTTVADSITDGAETVIVTLGTLPAGYTLAAGTTNTTTTAITDTSIAVTGSTLVLTTGVDNISGSTGNDTIIADNSGGTKQLSAADQINGGDGTDTLKIYLAAADAVTGQPALTSVENVYINGGAILSYTAATGTTSLSIDGAINTVTEDVTYTLSAQDLTLANKSLTASAAADLLWTVAKAGTATNTSQKITVNGITYSGTDTQTIDVTGVNVATLNLVTTGASSKFNLSNSTAAAIRTLNISGDQTLTLTVAAAPAAAITKIDASTATGSVSVNLTAAAAVAGALTFTGGSGNDTIKLATDSIAALVAGTQLDGGAGTGDKLSLFDTALSAPETALVNAVKNFEVLGLNANITLDASSLTTFKSFSVDTAGTTSTINSMATGSTVSFSAATTSMTLGVNTGVNDVVVNVGTASTAGLTVGTLVTTGIQNVTINSNGTAGNTITTLTNNENSAITIKGAADLTITNKIVGASNGSLVDASSGFTGKLSVIGSVKNDIIKGGSGDDTIQVGAGATTAVAGQGDTLTGNGGADIFKFVEADAANAATAFAALLKQSAGVTAIVKITDFVAGVDKILLQSDQTTGGAAVSGTSMALANAQTITTADTLTAVYAGITALAGSTAGGALAGVVVTVSAGIAAGKYLYIDDATAGVNNANDMLINITGITGTLAASDFTFA